MSTPEISMTPARSRRGLLESAAPRAATLAASLALFGGVFALAVVVQRPHSGILQLHAVPIAIFALQVGILAGLSATAFSLSLMFVWAEMEGVELLLLDYMSGAVPFLLVVFLCHVTLVRSRRDETAPARGLLADRPQHDPANELTRRENEVLGLLAVGHTNREIAEQLYLSVRTVESHRARVQRKLRISSRAELVRHAVERDLLRWTPPSLDGPSPS